MSARQLFFFLFAGLVFALAGGCGTTSVDPYVSVHYGMHWGTYHHRHHHHRPPPPGVRPPKPKPTPPIVRPPRPPGRPSKLLARPPARRK
ncbi:MAG: hypothetical protein HUK40_03415 [Desulfobacter sp.]|nr:hypothetical protein [Desulfobacter sp.]WDP85171.1 MAG: hypothetical protein HUN05_08500 [Desulfobacter sp.]